MRRISWPGPEEHEPRSKRPYRDAAIVYAGLAALIVVGALVTGGSLVRALVTAALFYLVATAWTWVHLRRRRPKEETE
jgi:Flp pilus assembly protein TadB